MKRRMLREQAERLRRKRDRAARELQRRWRSYRARQKLETLKRLLEVEKAKKQAAATCIQKFVRVSRCRFEGQGGRMLSKAYRSESTIKFRLLVESRGHFLHHGNGLGAKTLAGYQKGSRSRTWHRCRFRSYCITPVVEESVCRRRSAMCVSLGWKFAPVLYALRSWVPPSSLVVSSLEGKYRRGGGKGHTERISPDRLSYQH